MKTTIPLYCSDSILPLHNTLHYIWLFKALHVLQVLNHSDFTNYQFIVALIKIRYSMFHDN